MVNKRDFAFRALLLAGVFLQGAVLLFGALRDMKGVLDTLGRPALWRSAYFNQGKKFADYVLFLNENIPSGSRVVLPPADLGPKMLGTTPAMQFFLSPREVINCPDLACAENLSPENTTILVVDEFPGDQAAQKFGQRLMFDKRWGLLRPPGATGAGEPVPRGFSRAVDILLAALWPVLWLCALAAAGSLTVKWLAPDLPMPILLGLGYGLGLSELTAGMCLAWLAGAPMNGSTVLWTSGILLLASMGVYLYRGGKPSTIFRGIVGDNSIDPWQAAICLLAGLAAVISAGKGYTSSDEILLWGAKGYGIAATGSLANIQGWGTNTVIYPLHIPLLIAAFKALFAETLPAAKLAFSGYYLGLALLVYSLFVWKGVRREIAGPATLLLATAPLVFRHATIAYANLPFSFYLVSGAILLVEALQNGHAGIYVLSGICLVAAAWTRPEGLGLAILGVLVILGLAYRQRAQGLRNPGEPSLRQLAGVLAPLLVYAVFWAFLKETIYTQPAGKADLAGSAAAQVLAGNLHLAEGLYVLRSLVAGVFTPTVWGGLGFALVLTGLLFFRTGARWDRVAQRLAACGGAYAVAVVGMYFLTSYDKAHDISWWVSTGLERMLLPAMVLVWLGGILWVEPLYHGKDRPISTDLEQDGRL